jgi:enolase-phosphatase E1
LIWESGFRTGALQAHVYPDVLPAITAWRHRGIDVRIYSSGSIAAQRLFFGHVAGHGDCLPLFSGHYDTTSGSKRESASYTRIARDWGLPPQQLLFVSDIAAELDAALAAGLQVVASIRPGNAALPETRTWPSIDSFAQLELDLDP